MSFPYETWENEPAIDACVIVHNYLYLKEKYILLCEIQQQMEIEPVASTSLEREREREMNICREIRVQRCALQLLSRRISSYARRCVETGYLDSTMRAEIAGRAFIRHLKIENRASCSSAGRTEDEDEQRLLKIQRADLPTDFGELVKSMNACKLDDLHKENLRAIMVDDPKRNISVPSRFCSFHLAGFDLDEESTADLGPQLKDTDHLSSGKRLTRYVAEDKHYDLAPYSTQVISIRVVKAGPGCTYPLEVYGKVIARDEMDYKCVYLFNRERKDAQIIRSKKDMLALTGPYRALVTLGYDMYFEFDLKIKGKDDPDDQFSKGVISYYCNPDHKRIIFQLPSFKSTVKLVLQHVSFPVAASLEVSVVNKGPKDPPVHFDGKITAGTTKDYRQHMVLYDSSVRSGDLVRENGSLVLNRSLVYVNGYATKRAFEKDEELVLYVCFLDASREIEDIDKIGPEYEDVKDDEKDKDKAKEDKNEEEEKDLKNVVALKFPLREIVWEHGCPKLEVKVNWTAVLDRPDGADFLYRYSRLPDGCSIDYRWGICYE